MPPLHSREMAAAYNDLIATAGAIAHRMKERGFISERWEACLVAQLNATLYTLGFALAPGTIQIENVETGEIRVTQVETPKRKSQT